MIFQCKYFLCVTVMSFITRMVFFVSHHILYNNRTDWHKTSFQKTLCTRSNRYNNETLFARSKCDCFIMVAVATDSECCDAEMRWLVVSGVIKLLVIYRNFPETFRNFPETFRKFSVTETLPISPKIFEPYRSRFATSHPLSANANSMTSTYRRL